MRIPGLRTAKIAGRRWRSRLVRSGIILGYHRVTDNSTNEFGLCVKPSHFAAQMARLQQWAHPLPLREMVERALAGTLPSRAVAVTFDDGYADNLHIALPILAQYEIPATVFVTTGSLGGEFWWDELVRLVRRKSSTWWQAQVQHLECPDLMAIYRWLLPLEESERRHELDRLWAIAGGKESAPTVLLTEPEVSTLAASDWIEIGSHSVTHPLLDRLPPDEQAYEISVSRLTLESLIGQPVRSFSYPNGRHSAETIALTQRAGYALACSSYADGVWTRSDRHCLPRVWARDEPEQSFVDGWIATT